ncbi:MAG: efflux RND transporter periplasmic adaptor subunit [Acidiphilium sp.]|nr:efflux RND transporter periplasmic adaptor subunit [Acidiphilium sp.]MDD4934471.1 efflux RND transporter periplasmic adaptor subunit [Acidiphilium sp.]
MPVSRRRRVGLLALIGLAVVLGGVIWFWPPARQYVFGPASPPGAIVVSGNIEAHQSVLSFTQVAAPIVYLPFDEGADVAAGTVLARVDDRLYLRQVAIDRTNLTVAAAQVTVAQSNLAAARQRVVGDQFDLAEKTRDYGRAEALVKHNVVTRQDRDLAYTAMEQSNATLQQDMALVRVASDDVTLAQADVTATQAKLKLDEVTLSYTTLRAPFGGVISVRDAELGELAGPGVAIFTLDDLDHVWLRAYVNEPDLGKVRLYEPVDVTTDTYPGHVYHGRIGFIAPVAEFTPKTVETHAERVTLVYRIRIDIDNPSHELLPGMPADARIALLPAGQP